VQPLVLHVNGREHLVNADPSWPLLFVLRNQLGLTAAKLGCSREQCWACAVLVDGEPTPSCTIGAAAFAAREIVTLEGLGTRDQLHPIQEAFLEEQAAQCGYCTAGIILSAKALLDRTPAPTPDEIKQALNPHLCRCGAQPRVVRAVLRASGR
jgi:nicotinate dehydrogenase subunit A